MHTFKIGVWIFLLSLFIVTGHTPVRAAEPVGTYTYSRTLPASDLNKYSIEYSLYNYNSNCNDISSTFYATRAECTAALPAASTGAGKKMLDSCALITKQTYNTYSFLGPICSSSISTYGFTQTSGPSGAGTSGGLGGSPASGGLGGSPAPSGSSGGGLVNPLNSISSLPELLRAILGGVVQIGAIFLTVMIVYVGFLFVAARGNEEKISSARSALLWTIIGGLILLGASAIELVIEATVKTL